MGWAVIHVLDASRAVPVATTESVTEVFFFTSCDAGEEVTAGAFKKSLLIQAVAIGVGLGLGIVKRIVENHKGSITASSTPDQGATFVVYLPLPERE